MSERSLLLLNNLPKPARAAVAGSLVLGAALGAGGCSSSPENATLVGELRNNCGDKRLQLPEVNISDAGQKERAQERLLVVQRRLCATALEAADISVGLHQHKELKKDGFRFEQDFQSDSAGHYATLKAVHTDSGRELESGLDVTELNGDDGLLGIDELTRVTVTNGENTATVKLVGSRWTMQAEPGALTPEGEWPSIGDQDKVDSMDDVRAIEAGSREIQSAINDTLIPFAR